MFSLEAGEGGRLLSHIVDMCDRNNMGGYLVTMDTEKTFDSHDHKFILAVLKRNGFAKNFVSWVEVSLNNQESCVIDGGNTTRYFHLQQGARQGTLSQPIYSFYVWKFYLS